MGEHGQVDQGRTRLTVPCFTPGSLIATPRGELPVERLVPGDTVITRDDGLQPIRWVGRVVLGWAQLAANPHVRPVLLRQGSLGEGLPERDMMVSPNHRLLVGRDRAVLEFSEPEVLVAAKHLVDNRQIKVVESLGTSYIHILCDRHQVVLANGVWTESFQPSDHALKAIGNSQRQEVFELFPDLRTPRGIKAYAPARRTLSRLESLLRR